MVKNSRYRGIVALVLTALLFVVLISSCNNLVGFLGEESSPDGPVTTGVLAPTANARVLVGSPVQILSAPASGDVDQVELRVKAPNDEIEQLISRINLSDNGTARQQWTPSRSGPFTIMVVAYNANGEVVETLSPLQLEVIDSAAISVAPVGREQAVRQPVDQGAAFQVPTVTPATIIEAAPTEVVATAESVEAAGEQFDDAAAVFVLEVQETEEMTSTVTRKRAFPPPPPIPGVPYGPTQYQLSKKKTPPVCEAAKYIEPFVPNTAQRISITEPDEIPAKTVGGTLVHRAWRLQNIGTCTWGPGYELAFYGGRAMGSGGVAFEAFYPDEPDRRNVVANLDRLVVPEGQPNQVATVEVLLKVPVTPGIHQSYWRMRNPHGVYFGPIIGVTLEVIRDCEFSYPGAIIYGAPVINNFVILGVGDVFRPVNPINVRAELGGPVTLEWSILNAENYDIIVRDPIGNAANLATNNRTDRNSFIPTRLGEHTITLFADNGPCTAFTDPPIIVDVIPPEGEQFIINTAFNPSAPVTTSDANASFSSEVIPGTMAVTWQHFDSGVDEIVLIVDRQKRRLVEQTCYFEKFGLSLCFDTEGEFRSELGYPKQVGTIGNRANGTASVCRSSPTCSQLRREIAPDEILPSPVEMSSATHRALIYCPSTDDSNEVTKVIYSAKALKDGREVEISPISNAIEILCDGIFRSEIP